MDDVTAVEARVLLAEDNVVNQKVATKMLQRLGCEVTIAADGVDAVRLSGEGQYDLLFMDCQMPNLDGYGATRAIREREAGGPRVPIVAMTANAMQGDRERCLEAGMDEYVSKPVAAKRLTEVLVQLLDESRVTRA